MKELRIFEDEDEDDSKFMVKRKDTYFSLRCYRDKSRICGLSCAHCSIVSQSGLYDRVFCGNLWEGTTGIYLGDIVE